MSDLKGKNCSLLCSNGDPQKEVIQSIRLGTIGISLSERIFEVCKS